MKLFEFEGSTLFRKEGIPVPDFAIATSPEEAKGKAGVIGLPVIIKAQVLTGGRYLSGGVRTAENIDEAENISRDIFGLTIKGYPVKRVMIAPKIDTLREFYLGVTLDEYHGTSIVILSAEGGVNINEIAASQPEAVQTRTISITEGLLHSTTREMCHEIGLSGLELVHMSEIMVNLYDLFRKYDCLTAEINPLVQTKQGNFIALDSKVEIDDSSLYRHADLNLSPYDRIVNPLERKGKEIGVTYVDLDGDIAVIASGAGLGMASIDIISKRLRPANFLETGGAITADLLYNVMDLIMQVSIRSMKGLRELSVICRSII